MTAVTASTHADESNTLVVVTIAIGVNTRWLKMFRKLGLLVCIIVAVIACVVILFDLVVFFGLGKPILLRNNTGGPVTILVIGDNGRGTVLPLSFSPYRFPRYFSSPLRPIELEADETATVIVSHRFHMQNHAVAFRSHDGTVHEIPVDVELTNETTIDNHALAPVSKRLQDVTLLLASIPSGLGVTLCFMVSVVSLSFVFVTVIRRIVIALITVRLR